MGPFEEWVTEMMSDERRKDFRADVPASISVDVPAGVSYESVDAAEAKLAQWQWDELAVTPDLVRAMVDEKDLTMKDPLLLQVLTRIDWLLTSVLKTIGRDKELKQVIPEFMIVNLSGSGIRFLSDQEFPIDSFLILRLILRPFIPIQAVGKVLRVRPIRNEGESRFETATEFVEIAPADREAIIRHILRSQATIQRVRHSQAPNSVIG